MPKPDEPVKIWLWHFPICPMMIHSSPHLSHVILLPSFRSLPYPPGPFHCFPCSSIWSISPRVIISPCRFTISSLALFADMPVTPLCDSDDILLCDTRDYCFVNKLQFNFHTQFVFIRLRVLYTLPIYFCAATMSFLKLKEKQHLSSNNYDEWCVAMLVLFDTINGRKYVTSLHEDLTPEQQIVSAQVAAAIYCNVDAENKKVLVPSIASQEACNPTFSGTYCRRSTTPQPLLTTTT